MSGVFLIINVLVSYYTRQIYAFQWVRTLSVGSKYFNLRPRRGIVYLGELLLVIVCYVLVCLPTHGSANVHVISKQRTWLPCFAVQTRIETASDLYFPGEHGSPELNDLKHVDSADQFKLVVPAGGHHGRKKLVHQLLTMKMNSGAFIFARQLEI